MLNSNLPRTSAATSHATNLKALSTLGRYHAADLDAILAPERDRSAVNNMER